MRKAWFLGAMLLAAGLIALSALPAVAQAPSPYAATLLGSEEAPTPVDTEAQGGSVLQFSPDGSTLYYALWALNIENVTEAHIHMGPPGEPGPIVAWLYPSPEDREPKTIQGRFDGLLAGGGITEEDLVGPLDGRTMEDLRREIQAGNAFVNVHTTANPQGEIRGQIRPAEAGQLPALEQATTPTGAPAQGQAATPPAAQPPPTDGAPTY